MTTARLDIHRCPLCEDESFTPWLRASGFPLVRCSRCGHRYARSILSTDVLSDSYYNEDERDLDARSHIAKRKRFEEYIELFPELRRPGYVLDVGCNAGELLGQFQARGWHVAGVEMSPGPAALARRRLGATIHHGTIESFDPGPERYDLVVLSHVLEHLHRPIDVGQQLASLVKPSGRLLVEVPSVEDPLLSTFGSAYRPLCPGDHVSFFDRASLRRALEDAGWTVERLESPLHARDVFYGALLSSVDFVKARTRSSAHGEGGVVSQSRYRGHLRTTVKSVLDVFVEAADPIVVQGQRWLAPQRGAALIALARLPDPPKQPRR